MKLETLEATRVNISGLILPDQQKPAELLFNPQIEVTEGMIRKWLQDLQSGQTRISLAENLANLKMMGIDVPYAPRLPRIRAQALWVLYDPSSPIHYLAQLKVLGILNQSIEDFKKENYEQFLKRLRETNQVAVYLTECASNLIAYPQLREQTREASPFSWQEVKEHIDGFRDSKSPYFDEKAALARIIYPDQFDQIRPNPDEWWDSIDGFKDLKANNSARAIVDAKKLTILAAYDVRVLDSGLSIQMQAPPSPKAETTIPTWRRF